MDPLKAFAATLFCLALFGLVLRLTRRLMEMAIAAGHAEAKRRQEAEDAAEDAAEAAASVTGAIPSPQVTPAVHAAGAAP